MLRAALVALSILNVALAGVATVSLDRADALGPLPALVVLSLAIQGAISLVHLAARTSSWAPITRTGMFAGESAALLGGGAAALTGILYNLNPVNGDFEFAPMLLGGAFATHALVGLAWLAVGDREPVT
jgi:hypothetical protein